MMLPIFQYSGNIPDCRQELKMIDNGTDNSTANSRTSLKGMSLVWDDFEIFSFFNLLYTWYTVGFPVVNQLASTPEETCDPGVVGGNRHSQSGSLSSQPARRVPYEIQVAYFFFTLVMLRISLYHFPGCDFFRCDTFPRKNLLLVALISRSTCFLSWL